MQATLQRLNPPRLAVTVALLLTMTTGAAAQTNTVVDPSDTPIRVVKKLYMDLSGALRPKRAEARDPPMWADYLSARTETLYRELRALEEREGFRAFDNDWFCQCDNPRRMRVPVSATEQSRSLDRTEITVRLRFPYVEVRHVRLELVNEDGWKIDDIIDERGRRFTSELAQAIRHGS